MAITVAMLKAKEEVSLSFEQIAEKMSKSEHWVAEVFFGSQLCSVNEIEQLSGILKVESSLLTQRLAPEKSNEKFLDTFIGQLFDKVVIGAVVLIIALSIQSKYQDFSIKRQQAVAISNLNSSFLNTRYKQVEEKYFQLMVISNEVIRSLSISTSNRNKPSIREKAIQIKALTYDIETSIDVILRSTSLEQAAGKELVSALKSYTRSLISLNLVSDFEVNKHKFQESFGRYSTEVQAELVRIVQFEIDTVLQGESNI